MKKLLLNFNKTKILYKNIANSFAKYKKSCNIFMEIGGLLWEKQF